MAPSGTSTLSRRGLGSVVALLGATALAAGALSQAPARWLTLADTSGAVDAAVVLGGDPYYERTLRAASLIRTGRARLLVLTGGSPGPGDDALTMQERALELGVPLQAIRIERHSRTTHESIVAVFPLLRAEGVARVALVTSWYHQRRVFVTARRAWSGIAIVSVAATDIPSAARPWWAMRMSRRVVVTEWTKIVFYWVRGWTVPPWTSTET